MYLYRRPQLAPYVCVVRMSFLHLLLRLALRASMSTRRRRALTLRLSPWLMTCHPTTPARLGLSSSVGVSPPTSGPSLLRPRLV
jgi:hypothetical protein